MLDVPDHRDPHRRSLAAAPPSAALDGGFEPGANVRHPAFGNGIVISSTPDRDDYLITIAFKSAPGIKRPLLSLAPLELV